MDALKIIQEAEERLNTYFRGFEETAYQNQVKIINAFKRQKVRESHFNVTSGYGYGDIGRDGLEEIYADIFAAEDAMVRSQIVSGTHAISACLFGILQPGDELVSVLGSPYDTLASVIGKNNDIRGTLINKGIKYREVSLKKNGYPDLNNIAQEINQNTTMAFIQRSRGYNLRSSLTVDIIGQIIDIIKKKNPTTIVMVDNCYGEFTDFREPCEAGADIIAGSLIKNPGGGLAPSGGYIAGKKDLVELVSYYLTAPGLGKELGASLINNRYLYQGIFLAPHIVMQALKSACLMAYIFEQYGYQVYPSWHEPRGDIVQAIRFKNEKEVLQFCQVIQNNSPVDSDVNLEFAELPGYNDQVVMAAGTFVQGSSIELSCDAPLREPYCAYLQGGLTYEHCRYVVKKIIETILL